MFLSPTFSCLWILSCSSLSIAFVQCFTGQKGMVGEGPVWQNPVIWWEFEPQSLLKQHEEITANPNHQLVPTYFPLSCGMVS